MHKKINIIIFLLIIFVVGITNLGNTIIQKSDTLEVDESELMPVLDLQQLTSGNYFRAYDDQFTSNFLYRENLILLSERFDLIKGIDFGDDLELVSSKGINVANKLNEKEGVMSTEWGNILIAGDAAMEVHSYNEEAIKAYPEAINRIEQAIGIKTYSMLVPTQIEFEENPIYSDISYSQKDSIEMVNAYFNKEVTPIDVYTTLQNHKDEYIYMRTDHHWTALGAYYAYVAFIEALGEVAVPIEAYETKSKDGYLGSLYNLTHSSKISVNPDVVTAYLPIVETTYRTSDGSHWSDGSVVNLKFFKESEQNYGVFLGGDSPLSVITTSVDNDQRILVIKDSYANAFIPFLTSHYEEIHIIDPRMFECHIETYVADNDIGEVLFLNYVLVNRYNGYSGFFEEMLSAE